MPNDTEVANGDGAGIEPGSDASQPEPSPSIDVDALASALLPSIQGLVQKEVQSFKDKRFSKLDEQVGGFAEQLARLDQKVANGLTRDQALNEIQLEDRLAALEQGLAVQSQGTGNPTNNVAGAEAAQAVLKALGIKENTPEVTKIFSEHKDVEAQIAEILKLSATRGTGQEAPNPASVQPSGAGSNAYQDADQIAQRLDELYRNPTENLAEIARLNEVLDAMIDKR